MGDEVRLTMIGYTGSGKTCYLLGMYHQMQVGTQGFTMSTPDPDDGTPLEEKWEKLTEEGEDRWPLPNAGGFEEYQFVLEHGLAPFAMVDWVDYRGGTIDELYKSSELKELMSWLTRSTCVFLAVSGEYLAEDLTVKNATARIRVQKMNRLMAEVVRTFQPTHEKPLPVAIVITKYDYCKDRPWKDIERDIKFLFNPLFAKRNHLVFRAPSFLTAICHVTLGEELAGDKIHGTISPRFTQHPIFFATWATLRQQLTNAKGAGAQAEQISDIEAKMSLVADRIKSLPIYLEGDSLTP